MEMFEMRYFFAVAVRENIHRAAETLRVSPGSLSKAVARIEDELGVKLFSKSGRNIRLTDEGKVLKLRVSQILQLEESARVEIAGHRERLRVVMAGPEVLLAKFGFETAAQIAKHHPNTSFEYQSCEDEVALTKVADGEIHLAIVTGDVPAGLVAKTISQSKFLTVLARSHILYPRAKANTPIPVAELLAHPFVSPNRPLLGRVGLKQSLDGWRDDEFPRQVDHLTTSLKLLEKLVGDGKGLAYLPDYYAESLGLFPVKVVGCPYTCVQKIKLVARRPQESGWLNRLF